MSDNERSCPQGTSKRAGQGGNCTEPHVLGPRFWRDPVERTNGSAKPPTRQPIRPPSARTRQGMPMGVFGWPEEAGRPAGHRCIKECQLMADADDKKPKREHRLNDHLYGDNIVHEHAEYS